MNVVREINKINERELELGLSGASWHDEYKDSAYIFVGGLNFDLTEGDVITIFSQYGEVMDVNLPRDKETGKTRGFGFLMYEDQRSTVLAVDNLNGAKVLDRTLRVDHVRQYKQAKEKGEDGEMREREEQSLNAKPELIYDDASSESSAGSDPELDPDDPMAAYFREKRKEEKALKKTKKSKSNKHADETPEERKARKRKHKEKKLKKQKASSSGLQGVEALLEKWGDDRLPRDRSRNTSLRRSNESRSPRRGTAGQARRHESSRSRSRSRSRSPRSYTRGGYNQRQERRPSPMDIDRRRGERSYRHNEREERM